MLATLAGISLIIASACVFNNYIDRDIDKFMARTENRALVTKQLAVGNAIAYATTLGVVGFVILSTYTNWLTVLVGLVGFIDYVVLYGLSKRRSVHGTVIGSISGATPIVAGYTAVTNRFDTAALLLFLVLVFWQMPHFYAIAMRRFSDYKAAKLPVLPVKQGMHATKLQILFYVGAFIVATLLLTVFGYTGISYSLVVAGSGLCWLYLGVKGFKATDDTAWAKKMFLFSLIVLLVFCIMLMTNSFSP